MSKLSEMIATLCPNGVEYKKLGEVAQYSATRIDASDITSSNYAGVENLKSDKQGKDIPSSVPQQGRLISFESGDILIGNIRDKLLSFKEAS